VRNELSLVLIGACLLGAGWTAVLAARNQRVSNRLLIELGVVELLILAQLLVAVIALVGGDRPDSTVTFIAYAVGELVLLPAGVLWSQAERSRSSTLVILVACLGVAVMTARMLQIWGAAGG
jgi:hypothetical protein